MALYLLHSTYPLGKAGTCAAQHYLGYVDETPTDLANRLNLHRKGQSDVAIVRAFVENGATLLLGGYWTNLTRTDERKWKQAGHLRDRCNVCRSIERGGLLPDHIIGSDVAVASDKMKELQAAKIKQAASYGGADIVTWDKTYPCWLVSSRTNAETQYHVQKKQWGTVKTLDYTYRNGSRTRQGLSMFVFKCDCAASAKGLQCWHIGAVILWCLRYTNWDPTVYPLCEANEDNHADAHDTTLPVATSTLPEHKGKVDFAGAVAADFETWARDVDDTYGQGTAKRYCEISADEGTREASTWLETLHPVATTK
jgi:hypothetical protein